MVPPSYFSYDGRDGRNDSGMSLPLQSNYSSSSPHGTHYSSAIATNSTVTSHSQWPNPPHASHSTYDYSSAIAANSTTPSHSQWSNPPSTSQSTHAASRAAPANSAETQDGPWSQENPRLLQTASSSRWPAEWPTPAPTFDELDPRGYLPQALADNLATIDSILPPLPHETPTHLPSSPTSIVRASGDGNTIKCALCGVGFSGTWRRGNLNRHVKLKHAPAKGGHIICLAEGCERTFARSDARIKHMRKNHAELLPVLYHRRYGHEKEPSTPDTASTFHPELLAGSWTAQDSTTGFIVSPLRRKETVQPHSLHSSRALCSQDHLHSLAGVKRTSTTDSQESSASSLELTVGQWVPPSSTHEEPTVAGAQPQLESEATVEALPLNARIVFGSLYVKLDAEDYSRFCDTFFDRWASLLNHLRRKQSDAYALYAEVVKDLRAVVDAIDSGVVDLTNFGSIHQSSRPHTSQEGASRGSGGFTQGLGGIGAGSPQGRGSKPGGRKASKSNGPGNDARVAKKSTKKPNQRGVSCPEFKHWWMNRHNPSIPRPLCNGCSVTPMSQLRNHINRNDHGDFFVNHCQTCETDFVTQQTYDDHVAAQSCHHVPQLRNNIVTSWARLYIMKYPRATQIPNPYSDESGWLHHTIVAECRAWLNTITPSPFLGIQQGHSAARRPAPATVQANTPIYNAAMTFALQDAVAPSPDRTTNPDAAALWRSASRLSGLSLATPAQRDQFRRRLQGIPAQYYRALTLAPHYVTRQELAILADGAEAAARQIRILLERQAQQNQTQTQDQWYLTPVHQPPSMAGSSTQPSTQSRHTGSSRPPGSYNTQPSSVHDSADFGQQGPLPSGTWQRLATSPQAMYDGSRSRVWSPHQQGPSYHQASPYQEASSYQPTAQNQQLGSPFEQASPYQAGSPYSQEGLAPQQPWNFSQSPPSWPPDMPLYSPDGTVDPSILSSPGPDNGGGADGVRRRLRWPR